MQKSVEVQIKEFTQEAEVQLEEQKLSISESLQAGEIIEERASLEIDKAEKAMRESIEATKQQLMSEAQEAISQVEQQVFRKEEYDVLAKNKTFSKSVVDVVEFYETRVMLTCSVGDNTFLYEYELPITEYPIIPVPYIYTGTPYPISAVMPLIGKQQEINKAHQIMVHNASLGSSLRWMYEEGSIDSETCEKY